MKLRCPNGHEFEATQNALKGKKPDEGCFRCALQQIEKKHNIELLSPWAEDTKGPTQLDWLCNDCGAQFQMSKTAYGRKKAVCCKPK